MRVLGIIPARKGSQRVPGKNMRKLIGKPLVAWVLEAALASTLDQVVVSSDDPEVLKLAEELAPGSALPRPQEICTSSSPAIEYVKHAISATSHDKRTFDAVAIIQPSSPFTRASDIDGTVQLLETSDTDSAVTVVQVPHDLHPVKFKFLQDGLLLPVVEDEAGRASPEHLSEVYVRNGSVYCSRLTSIELGSILGNTSAGYVMPRERSVDINDEFDFAFAKFLAERGSDTH